MTIKELIDELDKKHAELGLLQDDLEKSIKETEELRKKTEHILAKRQEIIDYQQKHLGISSQGIVSVDTVRMMASLKDMQ